MDQIFNILAVNHPAGGGRVRAGTAVGGKKDRVSEFKQHYFWCAAGLCLYKGDVRCGKATGLSDQSSPNLAGSLGTMLRCYKAVAADRIYSLRIFAYRSIHRPLAIDMRYETSIQGSLASYAEEIR